MEKDLHKLAANTIRMLAVDGVQKANSGHPGMPMGAADCAFVLWNKFLKFNPEDPNWLNRDRFVLSAGHGSMLLYSLLHLFGYEVSMDDLKSFRQWGSRTAGHPEYGFLPGIETTTGPLGQGFAMGVGMAIAEKMFAERFNTKEFELFNHRIFAIAGDGDLMEGVSSEAASLAGHLKLGNIVYFYDDNKITIEGSTDLAFSENVRKRFESYGWHVLEIDGHNQNEIEDALKNGIKEINRPTLIIAKTHIGFGSPNKQDTSSSHGSPLGEEEVAAIKQKFGFPSDESFFIPGQVKELCDQRVENLKAVYGKWQEKFKQWESNNPELAKQMSAMLSGDLPDNFIDELINAIPEKNLATRASSGKILQKAAELVLGIVGGSADLEPSTKTFIDNSPAIAAKNFSGRNFHFGIREHGMGSILNGIALHSGFIPYGSTFLVFSDYMRPPIRLAAMMGIKVIYVFTHDSIFVGEDGPTHQPIEQIAALRIIPNLTVIRPADSLEVAMAWVSALENKNGPTVLALTRQTVPNLLRSEKFDHKTILKGGYIISVEKDENLDVVLVATGSEVSVALDSQKILEHQGYSVRVVSLPSLEIFSAQSPEYQKSVIPKNGCPVVVVEAGVTLGWGDIAESPVLTIGINRYGASAPNDVLLEKFGFTGEHVAKKVVDFLK